MGTMQQTINAKVIDSLKNQAPTCGDCAGFNCEIIRDKKLCSERGVIDTQKPCKQFVPDTNALSSLVEDEGAFIALARIVASIDDVQLRKLGAVLMREKVTRAQGHNLGERVYVRYRGKARSDYLSNFMTAYIMYADSTVVRVCSKDGKITMTFAGRATEAIYSAEQFEPIREKMMRKQKFTDPDVQKHVAKHLRTLEEYDLGLSEKIAVGEIPTIDKVFRVNKVKRVKGTPNDLVSIVKAIESGYEVPKNAAKKKKKAKTKKKNGVSIIDV